MSWTKARLKHLCVDSGQYGLNISSEHYSDRGVRLLRTTDISRSLGVLKEGGVYIETPLTERDKLQPGDLLLSRSGSLGQSYLVRDEDSGSTYAGYLVRFRPQPEVNPKFLSYVAQSHEFQSAIIADAVTSTIQNFNAEKYANIPILVPCAEEQKRIVAFLDAEIDRLDAVAERCKRQLELLEISDSSVIGDLLESEEARLIRVKHLASKITSGPRGWGELAVEKGEQSSLFLRITNIPRKGITLDLTDSLYVDAPTGHERERSRTKVGDVLVSITADIGSVAIVDARADGGNVSQHIALIRPKLNACDPSWLAYAIKSARSHQSLLMNSYGGTKVGLGLADIANLSVMTPSLPTQQRLASEISNALALRTDLQHRLIRQRTVLGERRQSLITAAVTGQIDVSTASGRGIED
ncbi:restriction endonuclease subunit S [Micromonospora zamorensis]|uniref:restriction endonuclease subunit S n=1 Tax=Micromonospora zamorensis TaxID=709883 RepID=UPI0033A43A99|nr:restriction endonuclease subunit S [Micromonospora zamorensis]